MHSKPCEKAPLLSDPAPQPQQDIVNRRPHWLKQDSEELLVEKAAEDSQRVDISISREAFHSRDFGQTPTAGLGMEVDPSAQPFVDEIDKALARWVEKGKKKRDEEELNSAVREVAARLTREVGSEAACAVSMHYYFAGVICILVAGGDVDVENQLIQYQKELRDAAAGKSRVAVVVQGMDYLEKQGKPRTAFLKLAVDNLQKESCKLRPKKNEQEISVLWQWRARGPRLAVHWGDGELLTFMLELGGEVLPCVFGEDEPDGIPLLHYAVTKQNIELCKRVCDFVEERQRGHWEQLFSQKFQGLTAFDLAWETGDSDNRKVAKKLLDVRFFVVRKMAKAGDLQRLFMPFVISTPACEVINRIEGEELDDFLSDIMSFRERLPRGSVKDTLRLAAEEKHIYLARAGWPTMVKSALVEPGDKGATLLRGLVVLEEGNMSGFMGDCVETELIERTDQLGKDALLTKLADAKGCGRRYQKLQASRVDTAVNERLLDDLVLEGNDEALSTLLSQGVITTYWCSVWPIYQFHVLMEMATIVAQFFAVCAARDGVPQPLLSFMFLLVMTVMEGGFECCQIHSDWRAYFMNPSNVSDLIMIAFSPLALFMINDSHHNYHSWDRAMVAGWVAWRWLHALYLLRGMRAIGVHMLPILAALRDSWSFGVVLAFVLGGCTQAYYVLDVHGGPYPFQAAFSRVYRLAILGDFDIHDLEGNEGYFVKEQHEWVPKDPYPDNNFVAVQVFFMCVSSTVTVALMNLFIGVLSTNYDAYEERRETLFMRARGHLTLDYLAIPYVGKLPWMDLPRKQESRSMYILHPDLDAEGNLATTRSIRGIVNQRANETDKRLDHLQHKVEHSMDVKMTASEKKVEHAVEQKVTSSGQKVEDAMGKRVQSLELKMEHAMEQKMARMEQKMEHAMDQKLASLEQKVELSMEKKMTSLERKMDDILAHLKVESSPKEVQEEGSQEHAQEEGCQAQVQEEGAQAQVQEDPQTQAHVQLGLPTVKSDPALGELQQGASLTRSRKLHSTSSVPNL